MGEFEGGSVVLHYSLIRELSIFTVRGAHLFLRWGKIFEAAVRGGQERGQNFSHGSKRGDHNFFSHLWHDFL